jgi:hypothetical protein
LRAQLKRVLLVEEQSSRSKAIGKVVRLILVSIGFVWLFLPAECYAIGKSTAAGKVVVTAAGSTALTSTFGGCATTEIGNVVGGAANFSTVFQPKNPNNDCTNTFKENGKVVGVFAGIGKIGASAVPKFPAGGGSSLTVVMTQGGGANPDTTSAQSSAGFITTVGPCLIPIFTCYTSDLMADANITKTTAKAPIGVASGIGDDPSIFAPSTATDLTLMATLQGVSLSVATSDGDHGFAMIQATAVFDQFDPVTGDVIDVLASDSYFKLIRGGTLTLPTLSLLNCTFDLSAGSYYELSVDFGTAAGVVPEPSVVCLLAVGTCFLFLLGNTKTFRRLSTSAV